MALLALMLLYLSTSVMYFIHIYMHILISYKFLSIHLYTEEVVIYVKQQEKQDNIGAKVGFLDVIEPINMM